MPMNKVATLAEIRPTSAIDTPDTTVDARKLFDLDVDLEVPAFSTRTEHVPEFDSA
jgi:cobaltochelatase CobS